MNKKTINTYQSLGRLIIDTVYQELLKNNGTVTYEPLKKIVYEKCIKQNGLVDKSFAMHKYNHSDTDKADWNYTYRWENIMYYYINQQYKAGLLNKSIITNNKDKADIAYHLTNDPVKKLLLSKYSLFDAAKEEIKQRYKKHHYTRTK